MLGWLLTARDMRSADGKATLLSCLASLTVPSITNGEKTKRLFDNLPSVMSKQIRISMLVRCDNVPQDCPESPCHDAAVQLPYCNAS